MAFGFFKKKETGKESESPAASAVPTETFNPDLRKARRFFEHGQAMADAHNYDYSIECYVNGLRHTPDNLDKYEALRDVALRRKVSGGKPMGMFEAMKGGGKGTIDKFAHALMLWAKSPLDVDLAINVMEACATMQTLSGELHMVEVIHWVAATFLEKGEVDKDKKPTKKTYLRARDVLAEVSDFQLAILACKFALNFSPEDANLLMELKDLEAELTMATAGYNESVKKEGGFRNVVRDIDKQNDLSMADQISKTESVIDTLLAKRQAEYEEAPEDPARLARLVETLLQKGTTESENEAIKHLRDALEQTGQYRYKVRIGDILMRQMNKQLRELKTQLDAKADDAELRRSYTELAKRKLQFELEEYTDRVKNYPTDMGMRFELGKRLYMVKRYDDAIAAFQEAQADAKVRIGSMQFLGMCYLAKGWFEEATGTLRKAIEQYQFTDDRLALDMRYLLMDALESAARKDRSLEQAKEAQQIASQIVQTSITYRDIRERMEKLKKLVTELSPSA